MEPSVAQQILQIVATERLAASERRVAQACTTLREIVDADVANDTKNALYVEYIAHELEHVLEAVDGTDLPRLSRQRVDGVINLGGSYETARAQSVGRLVAREVMP